MFYVVEFFFLLFLVGFFFFLVVFFLQFLSFEFALQSFFLLVFDFDLLLVLDFFLELDVDDLLLSFLVLLEDLLSELFEVVFPLGLDKPFDSDMYLLFFLIRPSPIPVTFCKSLILENGPFFFR